MSILRCTHCGREFDGQPDARYPKRYCSRACVVASQLVPQRPCPVCGSPIRRSWRKFCSPECGALGRRGRRVKVGQPGYERHRDEIIERVRADYAANPEKQAARNLAKKRIPIRPCESCGSERNVIRHHDDYARPLDVRFLCRRCHAFVHGRAGVRRTA